MSSRAREAGVSEAYFGLEKKMDHRRKKKMLFLDQMNTLLAGTKLYRVEPWRGEHQPVRWYFMRPDDIFAMLYYRTHQDGDRPAGERRLHVFTFVVRTPLELIQLHPDRTNYHGLESALIRRLPDYKRAIHQVERDRYVGNNWVPAHAMEKLNMTGWVESASLNPLKMPEVMLTTRGRRNLQLVHRESVLIGKAARTQ